MKLKELFTIVHSYEIIIILRDLCRIGFFNTLEAKTVTGLAAEFGLLPEKCNSIISYLCTEGILYKNNELISNSDFSKKYLCGTSKYNLLPYLEWRCEDFQHWNTNFLSVMQGKQKTIHTNAQYLEYCEEHKDALEGITIACGALYPSQEVAELITQELDEKISIVDVGCGSGLWGFEISQRSSLKITLFDKDITIAKKLLNTEKNLMFAEGDFFDPQQIPQSQAYLIANVCMDWSDEDVKKILENILTQNPTHVFIHEFLDIDVAKNKLYDIFAKVETLGRIRNQKWWDNLLKSYFTDVRFISLDFGSTLIVANK